MSKRIFQIIIGVAAIASIIVIVATVRRCTTDLPDHRDEIEEQRQEHREAVDAFGQREDVMTDRRDDEDQAASTLEERRREAEEDLRLHLDTLEKLREVSP